MILVTGGTGFIGTHLLGKLLAHDEPTRALVRGASLFDNTPVELVRGDLITGEGLERALQGVDTVIHLAGVTKPISTDDYYAGNVRATETLARAVAAAIAASGRVIHMVHVSSLAAVGPGVDATPVTEDVAPHPITHYGKSKLEGERIVRSILPNAVVVRPPAVYGPCDTDIFQILKSINQGILFQIAGGERYFSVIYVHDLVDGILAAARTPKALGRTYFLAQPAVVAWSELVGVAATIMGRRVRAVNLPVSAAYAVGLGAELWSRVTKKPGIVSRDKITDMRSRYWVCNTRLAKEELGFEAGTSINEGLLLTLEWYREAGWLKWG